MWEMGERVLREAMQELGLPFYEAPGEAAFYGPKLDIQIRDVLGREETISTIQVDFHLPNQFELEYIGEDSDAAPAGDHPSRRHRHDGAHDGVPHRAVRRRVPDVAGAGAGDGDPDRRPPHRLRARSAVGSCARPDIRAEVDARSERMNAKIRDAQLQKIPYMLVVGDREAEAQAVSVRTRAGEDLKSMPVFQFIDRIKDEIADGNGSGSRRPGCGSVNRATLAAPACNDGGGRVTDDILWIAGALALVFAINLVPAFMPSSVDGDGVLLHPVRPATSPADDRRRARLRARPPAPREGQRGGSASASWQARRRIFSLLGHFLERHRHDGRASDVRVHAVSAANEQSLHRRWHGRREHVLGAHGILGGTRHRRHVLGLDDGAGVQFIAAMSSRAPSAVRWAIALQLVSAAIVVVLYLLPWSRWLRRVVEGRMEAGAAESN